MKFVEAALAASDDCIKIIGLDGSLQYMSEGGQRVMEIDDFDSLKGCPWPDFWQDQGNVEATAAIEEAKAGRASRFTGFANTAKGNQRVWDVKVSPILGDDGTVQSILSVSRDITASKVFEEQQKLVRNELSHRIKNILSLVQAIANQTLKNDDQVSEVKPAFLARLSALGDAHDLLMQTHHVTTTLDDVVKTIKRDQIAGRVKSSGPVIELGSKTGLALALTLHELATNAVKYGALSNADGHVSIDWQIAKDEGEDHLDLTWQEHGGPEVTPPTRKGFGSRMIERALAGTVRGKADVDYAPTGLVFKLSAPVAVLADTLEMPS